METTARPEDVGISTERLAQVDRVTHWYVDEGRFPCAQTVISRRGQVVHTDIYGMADVEEGRKLTDDTIFRIYSMTKPITSLALMMLYEEGRVLLENPVSRFISSFADLRVWVDGTEESYETTEPDRPMTVHDVLIHTSGLTAGFMFQHPVDAMYRSSGLGDLTRPDCDLEEAMERLSEIPLLFSPGTRWNYGMSTDVVGRLVEVIADEPLDEFFQRRIFEPLGMVDTGFSVPKDQATRLAANYAHRQDGGFTLIEPSTNERNFKRPKYLSGAGGLVSTAADYTRFCHMLGGGGVLDGARLVGPKTLDYMTINHLPGGRMLNEMGQSIFSETAMEGTGFGLGFSVLCDPAASGAIGSVGEFAWGGAASTAFWVDPTEELVVVFLTQLVPSMTYPIRRQLKATVYQALID